MNTHITHRILTAAVGLSLLVSCSSGETSRTKETGELSWPEITRQNKPWTRWWWPASAVGKADMDTMLTQYSKAGLGGLEVTTIYGAKGSEDRFIDYLSKDWMDLFSYTLDKSDSLGLGIDLANASGWPFGGPWVTPDYACRYLAYKTYDLKGGETLPEKVEYVEKPMVRALGTPAAIEDLKYPIAANSDLQQHAFEQVRYPLHLPLVAVTANSSDGRYEDLTGKVLEDGTLDWTAPEGDWTVCALFLGWHGKLVERAGPGGEGDVIDHFSETAIKKYLAKFDEAFKGYDVSKIRYYFNDSYEVDDAVGNSDWTEDFFEQFKSRRGYDLKEHMPELLGLNGDPEQNDRVVFDYRKTVSELLIDTYSRKWQEWAAAQGKGIRNQAHGSPANILDVYAVSDVPETEGRSIIGMKTASSAAHVADKPLTSSESATWLNDHFRSTLGDVKTAMDLYFLAGVNHVFYHGTCMSPNDAQWPGWLFYAAVHFQPTNSFWPDFGAFNRYIAHCQSFLQAGRPCNDILLFFDATDLQSTRGREQMLYHMNQNTPAMSAIGESASALYEKGYTWDYVSDNMLLNNVSARNGLLVTKGGNSYRTIVVPKCGKMELETFEKLVALARDGASVIVEGAMPEDVPGLYNLEGRRGELRKLEAALDFREDGQLRLASCGKGRFILSDDLQTALDYVGMSRETMYDLGLKCISRIKDDGGRYYFLKNCSDKTVRGWIPVDVMSGSVGIYNPMTEVFGYGLSRETADGKTEVFMEILPDESFLLETFAGKYSGKTYDFYKASAEPEVLDLEWTVRFTEGGPTLPASRTVASLGSWTKYGKEYENFSGSALYTASLPAMDSAETGEDAWVLDLGDVRESAAVWLNGKYLTTLFKKPFAVTLTPEQAAAGGKLEVRVSSSCENRIAYMDRNDIKWRIFYNANIAARTRESRGADGYFSAAKWGVEDSGLLGPLTLAPLTKVTE